MKRVDHTGLGQDEVIQQADRAVVVVPSPETAARRASEVNEVADG